MICRLCILAPDWIPLQLLKVALVQTDCNLHTHTLPSGDLRIDHTEPIEQPSGREPDPFDFSNLWAKVEVVDVEFVPRARQAVDRHQVWERSRDNVIIAGNVGKKSDERFDILRRPHVYRLSDRDGNGDKAWRVVTSFRSMAARA